MGSSTATALLLAPAAAGCCLALCYLVANINASPTNSSDSCLSPYHLNMTRPAKQTGHGLHPPPIAFPCVRWSLSQSISQQHQLMPVAYTCPCQKQYPEIWYWISLMRAKLLLLHLLPLLLQPHRLRAPVAGNYPHQLCQQICHMHDVAAEHLPCFKQQLTAG